MKPLLFWRAWTAILALTFPVAAVADVSGTAVLQANNALSLDTGGIVSSGGDLLWNGSTLAPQGTAKIGRIAGAGGFAGYDFISPAILAQEVTSAKTTPIAANLLVPGDIFVVVTNGGKNAKLLVVGNTPSRVAGGASISLRFTTYGATAPVGAPVITDILNNSSHIKLGLPNYGIAPSSLFVVTGASLADPGDPVLQSSAAPGIPTSLNGASISVAVNGVTTTPALYYTSPKQLAAVLPASTPVGSGTFTVTYRGKTSPPAPIEVVPSAVGINTYNGDQGVATDAVTGALLTYTNSATPGQTIILWTTGLGADPADSDSVYSATPHSVGTPLQILIGGIQARVLYQGSAGYPGVNQINVVVPQSVGSGCWVGLAAVTGGVVSNIVTIPVNPGGGACVDPQSGLNGNQLSPSGGTTLRTGLVTILQTHSVSRGTPVVQNSAGGAFVKYTGLYAPQNQLSPGACLVNPTPPPVPAVTFLDLGALTMTGPSGTVTLGNPLGVKGVFNAMLPASAIPSTGGTYTFNGAGGADVGSFTATLTLASPLLVWTNDSAAASIDRTSGFQFTWSGGNPGSYVVVGGSATSPSGVLGSFQCLAPADAHQFTVPSYVLLSIPAGTGGAMVQNSVQTPLTATGLDIGVAIAGVSFSTAATYTNGAPARK